MKVSEHNTKEANNDKVDKKRVYSKLSLILHMMSEIVGGVWDLILLEKKIFLQFIRFQ